MLERLFAEDSVVAHYVVPKVSHLIEPFVNGVSRILRTGMRKGKRHTICPKMIVIRAGHQINPEPKGKVRDDVVYGNDAPRFLVSL